MTWTNVLELSAFSSYNRLHDRINCFGILFGTKIGADGIRVVVSQFLCVFFLESADRKRQSLMLCHSAQSPQSNFDKASSHHATEKSLSEKPLSGGVESLSEVSKRGWRTEGVAQGNPSHTIDSGLFLDPFSCAPLMGRRTQLWGTILAVFLLFPSSSFVCRQDDLSSSWQAGAHSGTCPSLFFCLCPGRLPPFFCFFMFVSFPSSFFFSLSLSFCSFFFFSLSLSCMQASGYTTCRLYGIANLGTGASLL